MRRTIWSFVAFGGLTVAALGCERRERAAPEGTAEQTQPVAAPGAAAPVQYVAELRPMNMQLGGGGSGTATLTVDGKELVISVNASGLTPGMRLMHYHGFVDGRDATCAGPAQDQNGDGVVDLLETEPVSGVTLVPFHENPAILEIESETYPVADERGALTYAKRVPIAQLEGALSQKHGIERLALDKRVVYLHGVAEGAPVPPTTKSLAGVPARVTVPVACGVLERKSPA